MIGALVGWFARLPQRAVASVIAFGGGVLISALSFELMEESVKRSGLPAAGIGFITGVVLYSVANVLLARHGAKHRKRSGSQQLSESEQEGSGTALLVGAMIDGIPESIAIGVSTIEGGAVGGVTVFAVFLSNIPEGLSSSAGMKKAGRSVRYMLTVWILVALVSGAASVIGAVGFRHAPDALIAGVTAVAAGGILAMIADTMIPEAFSETHDWAGLITAMGFLLSFFLSHLSG
ncbi:MAG: hypothetical protein WBV82_02365 [Myxococcaceae bacterium]